MNQEVPSPQSERLNNDEKNRTFLLRCTVALATLSLILYGFLRDPLLLMITGISGVGLPFIYRYYFRR